MSLEQEQIKDQLASFSGKYGPAALQTATVKSLNEDDTAVIVFADGKEIDDARLKAVVKDGNKVLLIPAINSTVLTGSINNGDDYVIVSVDAISEIKVIVDQVCYSVNGSGFLVKKNDDTLKQVLTLIVEAVQDILVVYGNNPDYVKLTQALTKINNLFR